MGLVQLVVFSRSHTLCIAESQGCLWAQHRGIEVLGPGPICIEYCVCVCVCVCVQGD